MILTAVVCVGATTLVHLRGQAVLEPGGCRDSR